MKRKDVQIVVVDDDESIRNSLTEFLKKVGYKVSAIASVDEALSFVKIKPVKLIIADCMLPKMNGVQFGMKLRTSRFGENPLILMSGIFKDKAFIQSSLAQTNAVGFLIKPFNLKDLKVLIETALKDVLEDNEGRLDLLVSRSQSSFREQLKIIETVNELSGYDMLLVLAVLMASEFTGHLNLVSGAGDIYGVTLSKGQFVKVDGSHSKKIIEQVLISQGMLTEAELADIKSKKIKGDLLAHLVEDNFVSPHFVPEIKAHQIFAELKDIFRLETVNLNLSSDTIREKTPIKDMSQLVNLFVEVASSINVDYFERFYKACLDLTVRKAPSFSTEHPLFSTPVFKSTSNLLEKLDVGLFLKDIVLSNEKIKNLRWLQFHLMALFRLVAFDDVATAQSVEERIKRVKKVLEEISGDDPKEIFMYFGASSDVKSTEVTRIFKEFVKANHPDSVPKEAPPELLKLTTEVFSMVSQAHDKLVDPTKREEYFNSLKQSRAAAMIQAENLAEEGLNHLRKGRVGLALPKLRQAYEMSPTSVILVAKCWGELKAIETGGKAMDLKEITKLVDSVPVEDRRTPHYQLVQGLLRKAEGDSEAAYAYFDKALALDAAFLDARREISKLGGNSKNKKGSTIDLFTGDITNTISTLFRRK